MRPEPAILHLLRAGHLGEACVIAARRLRASGMNPAPAPIRGRGVRDGDWRELDRMGDAGVDPRRLAAALLIPIGDGAANILARLVLRREADGRDKTESFSVMQNKMQGGHVP